MTLPEIAAEARRMAADYRRRVDDSTRDMLGPNIYLRQYCNMAAADFDRLAEMAEPKANEAKIKDAADAIIRESYKGSRP